MLVARDVNAGAHEIAADRQLAAKKLLNLNALAAREDLLPVLSGAIPNQRSNESEQPYRPLPISDRVVSWPATSNVTDVFTSSSVVRRSPASSVVTSRPSRSSRGLARWSAISSPR